MPHTSALESTQAKAYPLQRHFPTSSPLVYGCMGLGGTWDNTPYQSTDVQLAHQVIDACLEQGINTFDHADIYRLGKAELVFGEVLKQRPALRNDLILQSKCGIRFDDEFAPKRYDLSYEWIIQSVNGILKRLNTDYLDILLLHRPDPLMEPHEVARAFETLIEQGKVREFGVSNMNAPQMMALQQAISQPLICNQLEMSLSRLDWLNEGVHVNHQAGAEISFTANTMEYCQQHNVQLQAWGCLSQGLFSSQDLSTQAKHIQQTAKLISQLASEYGVSHEAVILSWLMRHPAHIQPVIGTTNLSRIAQCSQANSLLLSREHWYQIYVSARGVKLP